MTIQLDEQLIEDFEVIRDLGPAGMQALVDKLRQIQPAPMRPDRLIAAVAEDRNAAEAVVLRQGLIVYGWIRQGGFTVPEMIEEIREALRQTANWDTPALEDWTSVEKAFSELLSLPIIRLVASAIDLFYEYANLWRGARILTDIRPIFSSDASTIEGSVVSQTFRLRYFTANGDQELTIAMDESDIIELVHQCERALQKAQTACSLMKDRAGVPTVISGESENA